MKTFAKPVEILIVEDNEGDIGLIEEVFEEAKLGTIVMLQKMEKRRCSIR